MTKPRIDVLSGLAISLFAFCVYLTTLAPSVGTMDSGELAASAHVLGLAHPTGYPLYTLLAKGFSLLPLGEFRVIVKLNLLAALLCAAAVFLFHRLFLRVLTGQSPVFAREVAPADPLLARAAAATGAFILAFSRTFWVQAVSAEVYALHLVFLALLILLYLKALENPEGRSGWSLFAYMLGLSFTNHMTTVLLAPAFLFVLFVLFAKHGFSLRIWPHLARAIPAFLLGLSVYLYLPVRASVRPVMNWGDPSSWAGFWSHVSGAQFRDWMFSSPEVAIRNLVRFVAGLPFEFAVVPLFLAAAGLVSLRRREPRLLWFSLLIAAASLLYAVNYDIPDIGAYFLPAHAVIALWAAFGVRALLERSVENRSARGAHPAVVVTSVCAALAALPLALNHRAVDARGDFVLEDYARNMLASLEPDALLLSDGESSFYFTASYLQHVEGVRPDVAVIGYRALGLPWYYTQVEAAHPVVVASLRDEIGAYRRARADFDAGGGDSAAVAERFVDVVRALLRNNFASRPVYVTPDVGPDILEGYRAVPDGLALRVFTGTGLPAVTPKRFAFRPLAEGNPATASIRTAYAAGYCYQGVFQAMRGDTIAALALLRESLEVQPGFADAVEWTRRMENYELRITN